MGGIGCIGLNYMSNQELMSAAKQRATVVLQEEVATTVEINSLDAIHSLTPSNDCRNSFFSLLIASCSDPPLRFSSASTSSEGTHNIWDRY